MKRILLKLAMGITTILILGLLTTVVAEAYSQCYPGGGSCITIGNYYHTVTNTSGSYWYAGVNSYTSNPTTAMDDIGYAYWTIREWCNVTLSDFDTYGGAVHHHVSTYSASRIRTKLFCFNPTLRLGESLGNHDFYDHPYPHRYWYSYKSGDIP